MYSLIVFFKVTLMTQRILVVPLVICCLLASNWLPNNAQGQQIPDTQKMENQTRTAAFQWLSIMLEAAARDVERVGAQPTILSRQMAIPVTAMFDAWAAYDQKAVGTMHGDSL